MKSSLHRSGRASDSIGGPGGIPVSTFVVSMGAPNALHDSVSNRLGQASNG